MESHAQSVEDNLIDSLSFKLRPGASYVNDRKSVSFFTQGGNEYQPNGVRVIKIMLNGDSWLDPSTVKIFCDITNTTNDETNSGLLPKIDGAWGFFKRMRILCGGQIVEDIDEFNRLSEMYHMMKPTNKRQNDAIEGFGGEALGRGAKRTVCFTPMSGLFGQNQKFLPIRYAPIQIELELVSNAADVLFVAGLHLSTSFKLENVQLKADLVTLDNSLDNEYSQHLLSGKTLPIHFSTFTCASQVITSLNTTVNVSRALTRLKGVFVTLSKSNSQEVDNFYHPMGGNYEYEKELEFEMQIGSKKFPEYPIRSVAEAFYQLRKALGLHDVNAQMDISGTEFRSSKFVVAIDTEKVLGSSFSGYNSKSGDLLTLKLKPTGDATIPGGTTAKLHYCLHFDSILNIKDAGVEILE